MGNNLLAMMSRLKSLQGSKPNLKQNFKDKPANRKPNLGTNLASLLASVTGEDVQERGKCVWVTGIPESYRDADKLLNRSTWPKLRKEIPNLDMYGKQRKIGGTATDQDQSAQEVYNRIWLHSQIDGR